MDTLAGYFSPTDNTRLRFYDSDKKIIVQFLYDTNGGIWHEQSVDAPPLDDFVQRINQVLTDPAIAYVASDNTRYKYNIFDHAVRQMAPGPERDSIARLLLSSRYPFAQGVGRMLLKTRLDPEPDTERIFPVTVSTMATVEAVVSRPDVVTLSCGKHIMTRDGTMWRDTTNSFGYTDDLLDVADVMAAISEISITNVLPIAVNGEHEVIDTNFTRAYNENLVSRDMIDILEDTLVSSDIYPTSRTREVLRLASYAKVLVNQLKNRK